MCYYAYIDSIINYASAVFVHLPVYLRQQLSKLSDRAHYIICSNRCVPDPNQRRKETAIKLLVKAQSIKDHMLHSLVPPILPG